MNPRELLLWAAPTAALLGLGVVLAWPASAPQAQVADAFARFSANCRDFDKAYFTVGTTHRRGSRVYAHKLLVHARSDERIGIDFLGQRSRITWDGQIVRFDHSTIEPRRDESLEPFFADVWSECRSGFANSEWIDQGPWEVGLRIHPGEPEDWARLDLPFAWAQGVNIFVGVEKPELGQVMEIIIEKDNSMLERLVIRERDWNSNFPDQALLPDSPPFDPPRPSYWGGGGVLIR